MKFVWIFSQTFSCPFHVASCCECYLSTINDRYSGDRFSGNDGFSGTNTPDNAILFTVSGITILVELFWKISALFVNFLTFFMQKVMIFEKNMTKSVKTQEKSQTQGEKS